MSDLHNNYRSTCGLELPPVYITTRDFARLESLARLRLPSHRPAAALLAAELDRAIVCRPENILRDVVTMGTKLVFRTSELGKTRCGTLVYPHQHRPGSQCISVLTPLGAAVVGLRAGSRMLYTDANGVRQEVIVQKVAFQPEAEERTKR